MKKSHNFRELNIWKDSMSFVENVYSLAAELPDNEKFGLISQIQRSSISIPSNIAEGSGRTSEKEFIHFLKISLSSSYELETQLILANKIYKFDISPLFTELHAIQKQIGGFLRKLNNE